MSAAQSLAKLKSRIDLSYYLCPEDVKAISDACANKPTPKPAPKPAPKPIKKSVT